MPDSVQNDVGLLFLHALPLDGSMWADFVDFMPNLSSAPTLYEFGNTVRDWAEGALRTTSSNRLIVVGCSIGGSCALEIAKLAPQRVEALVLIGTKADHRPDPTLRDSVIEMLQSQGIEHAWNAHWAPLFSKTINPTIVAQARRIALGLTPEEIARGVSVFHSRPSRAAFAASWQKRTFVVTGEDDTAPGLVSSQALAGSLQNARCEVVRGSGHYVPLEQPEALKAILENLIASVRR